MFRYERGSTFINNSFGIGYHGFSRRGIGPFFTVLTPFFLVNRHPVRTPQRVKRPMGNGILGLAISANHSCPHIRPTIARHYWTRQTASRVPPPATSLNRFLPATMTPALISRSPTEAVVW